MGHTDDQPFVPKTDHANNWALSAERAGAVAAFLQEKIGVPPELLSATGFGPCRPIASNDTPEGRQQNRRIEIVLQSTE
jgi:chemotaxis protein MotB